MDRLTPERCKEPRALRTGDCGGRRRPIVLGNHGRQELGRDRRVPVSTPLPALRVDAPGTSRDRPGPSPSGKGDSAGRQETPAGVTPQPVQRGKGVDFSSRVFSGRGWRRRGPTLSLFPAEAPASLGPRTRHSGEGTTTPQGRGVGDGAWSPATGEDGACRRKSGGPEASKPGRRRSRRRRVGSRRRYVRVVTESLHQQGRRHKGPKTPKKKR